MKKGIKEERERTFALNRNILNIFARFEKNRDEGGGKREEEAGNSYGIWRSAWRLVSWYS